MLVKAFFTEPKVILLDEPTASLDPEIAQEVCRFLLERREKTGISVLFTSHKMQEAMLLCDRTIFLKEGKIVADERPEKLAKSISRFSLKLTIADGLKRTQQLIEERKFPYRVEQRNVEIFLERSEIPPLLTALTQKGVNYTAISIIEPSLEDYFLHLTRQNK